MSQSEPRLLTVPDELTLMIFNDLHFEDRRAILQVNQQLLSTFSPEFFECLGFVDVNFLEASHANLNGYELAGHRVKNLAIHSNAYDIYPTMEQDKLKEILEVTRGRQLNSLVFSAKSTICASSSYGLGRQLPSSIHVLQDVLLQSPLPYQVVIPRVYALNYVEENSFGAIASTSATLGLQTQNGASFRHATTFYLRPGTLSEVFEAAIDSHGSEVSRISLFGHFAINRYAVRTIRDQYAKLLISPPFKLLRAIEFHTFELSLVIDTEFLPSIEELGFFNITKAQTEDDRGQEEMMKRFVHIKSKHSPASAPILRMFKHRQTIRWPTGSQTVPGRVLAAFVQQFSGMLVQVIQQDLEYVGPLSDFATPALEYACHQHGQADRPHGDTKAFFKVANGLVGWGMNFKPILYSELMLGVSEDFKQEADRLADALSPAMSLKVLLLITPATTAAFNKVAKQNQRRAVKYLVDKLADGLVFLEMVFVANRSIVTTASRRHQIRQAACYRIKFELCKNEEVVSVVSPLIKDLSPKETEALKNLGGDILFTFDHYERDGLGALYLGEDETKVCQQKRDERLERERMNQQ
ncbi:hypothetical protein SLS60_001480 [Paraconiothyrium brasiliense]|uniref:F-box domain-containing protein n=1 Tax=Paraconiothyrium brasiliense TaxID=300254 RepID=A0ABR3S9S5_9PLEO